MREEDVLRSTKTSVPPMARQVLTWALQSLLQFFDDAHPPASSEFAAVSIQNPKIAALCYDRVWSVDSDVPSEIAFRTSSISAARWGLAQVLESIGNAEESDRGGQLVRRTLGDELIQRLVEEFCADTTDETMARTIAAESSAALGLPVVPVYPSIQSRDSEFKPGERDAVVMTIRDVAIGDESNLTWEQVVEFRSDTESRMRYRRFIHWLDSEMIGKSEAFIRDEIALRLQEYENAMKKHGIKTVLGVLSRTLDSKVLLGGSAAVASLSFAAAPIAALFAGGAVVVGRAAIEVASALLDIQDNRARTYPEVAFLAEMRKAGRPNSR